ncbi:MAG: TonB family protein [Pyrinomonadaceae bacterium]
MFVCACLFVGASTRVNSFAQDQTPTQAVVIVPDEKTQGISAYKRGDNEEALKFLRAATKRHKDDAEAWYYIGLALMKSGKAKDASKAFETVVKLQPHHASAHTGLAYSLLVRNKLSEASRKAQRALTLNPQDAEAHYIQGVVKLRTDEFAEALSASDAAIRMKPGLAAAYLLKSQAVLQVSTRDHLAAVNHKLAGWPPDEAARKERRREQVAKYKAAAESLETYLKLETRATDADAWREQLTALRAYAMSADVPEGERVFSLTDGIQKAIILAKPEPEYTEAARQSGVEGPIVLRLVLASDGTIKHVLVLQALSHGLTEKAVVAARKIKFTPAMKDGRSVSQVATIVYNFNIY